MPRTANRIVRVTVYSRAGPKGERWYIQWRKDGKRYQEAVNTDDPAVADEFAKRKTLELNGDDPYARRIMEIKGQLPESTTPSFWVYCKEYLKRRALSFPDSQERTEQTIKQHLNPTFGKTPLDEISFAMVEDWATARLTTDGVKHANVKREYAVLKAVLNDAVRRGVIVAHNAKYQLPKNREAEVIRVLTPEQFLTIAEASNPEHRAVWVLMVNTGLRRGEALAVRHRDVQPMNGSGYQIVLDRSITKGRKTRRVPLNAKALQAIADLKAMGHDEYILPRWSLDHIGKAFKRDATRAALGEASLHWLRHSCASAAANAGVPLQNVQAVLGHADISTTMRYVHPSDDLAAVTAAVNLG